MMCEAEKAQPGLQVLGTVTTGAGNALPWVHVSQCDPGILEAGAGPGLSRVKVPVWGFYFGFLLFKGCLDGHRSIFRSGLASD